VGTRAIRAVGGAELTAGGVASDKPDRGGTEEQDDPDDREPKQTLEGEPDNRRDKPEHEQNDDENDHAILRTFQKLGYGSSVTYPSLRGDVEGRASRTTPPMDVDSLPRQRDLRVTTGE